MASVTRRVKRLLSGKCGACPPQFTEIELRRMSVSTRGKVQRALGLDVEPAPKAPEPAVETPAPKPVPEAAPKPKAAEKPAKALEPAKAETPTLPVWDGAAKGTVWTPKAKRFGGASFGPWKNQTEAKTAVRLVLGTDKCPPGEWSRH